MIYRVRLEELILSSKHGIGTLPTSGIPTALSSYTHPKWSSLTKHSELRQLVPADPDAWVHLGWSGWFENGRRLTHSVAGQEEAD